MNPIVSLFFEYLSIINISYNLHPYCSCLEIPFSVLLGPSDHHFAPSLFLANHQAISQVSARGLNYGFVEYEEQFAAERAMQSLNGRRVISNVGSYHFSYFTL